MTSEHRFYEIARQFPTMNYKGIALGGIPGIGPDGFYAEELSDFLYHGGGRAWSTGEKHTLEFLLNSHNPGIYDRFNLGHAMNVWDPAHMNACLKAMVRLYNNE